MLVSLDGWYMPLFNHLSELSEPGHGFGPGEFLLAQSSGAVHNIVAICITYPDLMNTSSADIILEVQEDQPSGRHLAGKDHVIDLHSALKLAAGFPRRGNRFMKPGLK